LGIFADSYPQESNKAHIDYALSMQLIAEDVFGGWHRQELPVLRSNKKYQGFVKPFFATNFRQYSSVSNFIDFFKTNYLHAAKISNQS
jgi:hypothetical protein